MIELAPAGHSFAGVRATNRHPWHDFVAHIAQRLAVLLYFQLKRGQDHPAISFLG
jgi:hypothetical protein